MPLNLQDKGCKTGEKGWVFVYELAIYNGQERLVSTQQVSPGYFKYTYIQGLPTIEKKRIVLNDQDKSHQWRLGGTKLTPFSTTTPSGETFNAPLVDRLIEYEGGTPQIAYRETSPKYTWQRVGGDIALKEQDYELSSPGELLDYRFIFCPQEDEIEWEIGDCDCPDKTKQQPANQDSPNPSEWSDRSWVDSQAGARGHCLHEYASYKYVGKPQPQPPLPESEV